MAVEVDVGTLDGSRAILFHDFDEASRTQTSTVQSWPAVAMTLSGSLGAHATSHIQSECSASTSSTHGALAAWKPQMRTLLSHPDEAKRLVCDWVRLGVAGFGFTWDG